MEKLKLYTKDHILALTNIRSGETKLGERVQTISNINSLALSSCKFVLVGLPEDIGVKANLGFGGTRTAWDGALRSLLNIQSTERFRGDELTVLGHIDFDDKMGKAALLDPKDIDDL